MRLHQGTIERVLLRQLQDLLLQPIPLHLQLFHLAGLDLGRVGGHPREPVTLQPVGLGADEGAGDALRGRCPRSAAAQGFCDERVGGGEA